MPETLADLLKREADQHRDVHSVQTLFLGGDLLLAFTCQGGEVVFYYLVGNRLVPACLGHRLRLGPSVTKPPRSVAEGLDQHLATLPDALRADWGDAFQPTARQCPKCAADLPEEYETPGFLALRGGVTPSTPDGPGEHWTEGIYTCFACGHQWEGQNL